MVLVVVLSPAPARGHQPAGSGCRSTHHHQIQCSSVSAADLTPLVCRVLRRVGAVTATSGVRMVAVMAAAHGRGHGGCAWSLPVAHSHRF